MGGQLSQRGLEHPHARRDGVGAGVFLGGVADAVGVAADEQHRGRHAGHAHDRRVVAGAGRQRERLAAQRGDRPPHAAAGAGLIGTGA